MEAFVDGLKEIITNPWVLIFGSVTLLDISPIKVDPWKALLRWIGNVINGEDRKAIQELKDEIKIVRDDVSDMKREREDDKAKEKRWHILDFMNSCRHGRTHTREEWNHTLSELAEYEKYTEDKNIPNGVIEEGARYLRELFQENNRTNNFL